MASRHDLWLTLGSEHKTFGLKWDIYHRAPAPLPLSGYCHCLVGPIDPPTTSDEGRPRPPCSALDGHSLSRNRTRSFTCKCHTTTGPRESGDMSPPPFLSYTFLHPHPHPSIDLGQLLPHYFNGMARSFT